MSAFTEANRRAFDELSATYNTKPWQITLANQVAQALQARKDWLGAEWVDPSAPAGRQDVRLLDYACGTGAITKALGPFVHTIRGIDISENMVTKYNEAARSSGLTEQQAHAIVGNLLDPAVPATLQSSEWHDFDTAVIGLGFHHFEDPALAITRLAARLKPATGVLVIIDFLPFSHPPDSDPSSSSSSSSSPNPSHDMAHTIKHNGFTGSQMRSLYTSAGLEAFDIIALKDPIVMQTPSGSTVQRTLFIAKGRRAPTAWQKLGAWLGGMQDWAASGVRIRRDDGHWDPGFANDNARGEGAVLKVGRHREEGYDGFAQEAPRKAWNGF